MPAVETIAAGVAAAMLGIGLGIEKLEKRGMLKAIGSGQERPPWAEELSHQIERQNDVLILMAEQQDGVDAGIAAEYLEHDRKPELEDVVAGD